MKNKMKLISMVVVIMIMIFTLLSVVYEVKADFNPGNIINKVGTEANTVNVDTTSLNSKAGKILAYIRNIAVIAGVIIITILGVKYMTGSLEEKAEYKKSFIPLIVGIIVIMAATAIATTIFSIAS
jgi:type IV secretory pathway VirB2 component (pilin)